MKKIISILVSIAIMLSVSVPAFADYSASDIGVTAYSPEFPDAYLEYGNFIPASRYVVEDGKQILGSVTVTAFCEEAYNTETGAKLYSRLMTKDEVDAWEAEGFSTEPVPLATWGDVASKGKLNIELVVFQLANDGTSGYNTNLWARARANWSGGPEWGKGSTCPSWGEDVIGLSWSHNLDGFNRKQTATSNKGDNVQIAVSDYSRKEYVTWEFVEQFGAHVGSIGGLEYASSIECSTGLGVPTSVYGQKADIAMTYTHSYSDVVITDLTFSVEASADGWGGGLEISFGTNVDSWSIIAIADRIKL